jgi:hypothetical protein
LTQGPSERLSVAGEGRAVRDEHALDRQIERRREGGANGCLPALPDPAVRADPERGAEQHIAGQERTLLGKPVDELGRTAGRERLRAARAGVPGPQGIGDSDAATVESARTERCGAQTRFARRSPVERPCQ